MNPPLELIPCAGFANRLRAMVSGMCAAEDLSSSLLVLWKQEPNILIAPFSFLFDTETLPAFLQIEEAVGQPHSGWLTAREVITQEDWDSWLDHVGSARPIKIKSHGHFYRNAPERWLNHLRSLQMNIAIQAERDIIFGDVYDRQVVGVHIRRGDNKRAIKESPTELFIDAMAAYPKSTLFYLATDSMEERRTILANFLERVIVGSQDIAGRNDPFGCREAVLDFLCLSKCSEILGSYYSSFGEMAAAYGGVPLRVLRI